MVKQTVSDKIIGVCQRSIQFLINLCNGLPNVRVSMSQQRDLNIYADHILYTLIEKLGDNL